MKRISLVILILLVGLLGVRQEEAYSFADCPMMTLATQAPMACCTPGSCHCAVEKSSPVDSSEFLDLLSNTAVDIDSSHAVNSRTQIIPVFHEKLLSDPSGKSSSSQDKLYELYSDYRI